MRRVPKPACSALYLTVVNMAKTAVSKRTALHPIKIPTYYPAIWTKVCQGRSQGRFSYYISFRLHNYSVEMVGVEAPRIIINSLSMTKFVIVLQYGWPTKLGTQLHNFIYKAYDSESRPSRFRTYIQIHSLGRNLL